MAFLSSGFVLLAASSADAADASTCTGDDSPAYVGGEVTTRLTPVDNHASTPQAIDVGSKREVERPAAYVFTVDGPDLDPENLSWEVVLVDGNKAFPSDKVRVTFSTGIDTLHVQLCLDPDDTADGSYAGTLTVAGPRVEPVHIPLTVNLKYERWYVVAVCMIAAAVLAVFVKWWFTKLADKDADNAPDLQDFWTWIKFQWVTVLIAVLSVTAGLYLKKYLTADAFVFNDLFGLTATTFSAVMSASLIANALGLKVQPKKNGVDKTAH